MRDYEVTEGSVVPVEISVLSGILGREVVVIVSTVDDSAEGNTNIYYTNTLVSTVSFLLGINFIFP